MILILTDENEPTSDLVVSWLIRLKKKFIRISKDDNLEITKISLNSSSESDIEIKCTKISDGKHFYFNTSEIKSYWYRRSYFNLTGMDANIASDSLQLNTLTKLYKEEEHNSIYKFLHHILKNKAIINNFSDTKLTKLEILDKAKSCGLLIPNTIITKLKKDVKKFKKSFDGEIITKPIGDPSSFFHYGLYSYTKMLNVETIPEMFDYSLFQQLIQKKFELRIFYLDRKFYTTAVLSQFNEKSKIDLKAASTTEPNRIVPYILPDEISIKLLSLMDFLNLKSGSIDLIYTIDNNYLFLEVNPLGQFEQVSIPGNFNLFKKIAELL